MISSGRRRDEERADTERDRAAIGAQVGQDTGEETGFWLGLRHKRPDARGLVDEPAST